MSVVTPSTTDHPRASSAPRHPARRPLVTACKAEAGRRVTKPPTWPSGLRTVLFAWLALALAGGSHAQPDPAQLPPGAVHDPSEWPRSGVPNDYSYWEWYQTVWGEPLREMIASAEGEAFDTLQDRLGQVYLNADGSIGFEVSEDLMRMIARHPERALSWWLAHPGTLDDWLDGHLGTVFISAWEDGRDIPDLRALQAEAIASLGTLVNTAPPGRLRQVAACLRGQIASKITMKHQEGVDRHTATDVPVAEVPPLPYSVQVWGGRWISKPPEPDAVGVAQGLDFEGGFRFDDLEALEVLQSGIVVLTIDGKRAVAFFPEGERKYLFPRLPRQPVICEGAP